MRYTVEVNETGSFWYKEGTKELHREGGPAIEYSNGDKYWYKNNQLHREDGPAMVDNDGNKWWFLDGKEHSKEGYNKELNRRKSSCSGKVVDIDGKKYKLTEI